MNNSYIQKNKKQVIVMFKNKMLYGLLALFVGLTMSLNTVNAQVTGEEDIQSQNNISGEVVDAETGEALSDVTVMIEGMDDHEATTDENGEFTFENFDPTQTQTEGGMEEGNPSEITFTISHDGYQDFSKTLQLDELMQRNQGQEQQSQDDNPLRFELEPEEGDDYEN